MRYKLIKNSLNDTRNIISTILKNRGIDEYKYLNLDSSVVQDYNDLDNMQEAVDCFVKHFTNKDKIVVMPDCDPDGQTSSTLLYLYIKSLDKDYPIEFVIHGNNKSHGLNDGDYELPEDTKLFIIADAATNDVEKCNELIDNGIDIIVLDHHEQEQSNIKSKAIIVNNQISPNYHNKQLSGVGIAYRFVQALDEELWCCEADNFLDLVAFGNIADSMDLRSCETRYLVDEGLGNINNKFLLELIKSQDYSMKSTVNIHNCSWFLIPVVNALIRVGSFEERTLLFRAFIEDYEEFDYKKRNGTIVKENIYERVARLCKNAKARQDKARDKLLDKIKTQVDLNDKVCMIKVDDGEPGIIGLSAMRLSDGIKRPCIVVKEDTDENGDSILRGSCRNFDLSPIEDLKEVINKTGEFILCQGHANAAGVILYADNFDSAKNALNELLKDITYDSTYLCDFIINIDDLSIGFIQDIDKLKWLWCTGIKEPLVAIEHIEVRREDIRLQGANLDSISFSINDIKFVQFKLKDGDPLYDFMNVWGGNPDDVITLNVIGECNINEYQGILEPQIIIKDCEVVK